MNPVCSPFCPFLACSTCDYQGTPHTPSGLSDGGETLERREQGCNPHSRLTPASLITEGAAMHATRANRQARP